MAFFEQRVGEPKLSKCGTFNTRTVKTGNRVLGHIEAPKLKPGVKTEAIYWMGPMVACLAANGNVVRIDRTALANLAMYGVKKLGLRLDDGSTYVAPLAVAETPARWAEVPYILWEVTLPSEEERVANTMGKMRVAGGRRKSPVTGAST